MSFDRSWHAFFFKFDIEICKNIFIKTSSEVVILWFERFFWSCSMHRVFGAEFVSLYNRLPWHEEQTVEGSAKLATQIYREVSSHFRHLRCLIKRFRHFTVCFFVNKWNTQFMQVCKHCKSPVEWLLCDQMCSTCVCWFRSCKVLF